jgi:hypothetical protein
MNWRRDLFRLWIVGTVLFVLAVAFISYGDIKEEFEDAAAASASVTDQPVTKQDSVDPWAEFRIAPKPVTDPALIKRLERMPNPWASLGRAATIAFVIPLAALVLGSSLVWAFSGFAAKRS